ncbi:hypothetical protein MA04_01765 [Alcanivorax balearicus MACL04]|uniref:Transmembrane protein n=1 Tax=Alloalcanivorax balearicus MACL04 TaxID=1177182 RepID=A0ABT2QY70_9GAMM|nr:hypothetical protein [Alloalcanivorax balearicus]MCU5782465.1 hypothetical protein [Alloalcanivorax balearicus MACL04]
MKHYYVKLSLGLLLYVALLFAAQAITAWLEPSGTLKLALHLLPMVGALVVARTVVTTILGLDELQRRIQLEAIALSFMATALATFTWGFAQDAGMPALPIFAVWPMMAAFWVISLGVVSRKYA